MSNPWVKFYPSDWRADPALRMCSIGARGLWMEMLCVMHENGGELAINGKALTERQLANLAGCGTDEASALLSELDDAGVFSRRDDGTIFSRRMIRDAEKAAKDKANGSRGGNPDLRKGVNPPVKGEDKAQKPEARSHNPEESPPSPPPGDGAGSFEGLLKAYPPSSHTNVAKAERQHGKLSLGERLLAHSQAAAEAGKAAEDRKKRGRDAGAHAEFVKGLDAWLREGAWRVVAQAAQMVAMTKLDRENDAELWQACEAVMGKKAPTAGMTWMFLDIVIAQARERSAA